MDERAIVASGRGCLAAVSPSVDPIFPMLGGAGARHAAALIRRLVRLIHTRVVGDVTWMFRRRDDRAMGAAHRGPP
jgi:hypothetical protein